LVEGELVLMSPPLDAGAAEPAAGPASTGEEPNDVESIAAEASGDMAQKIRTQLKTAAQPSPERGPSGDGKVKNPAGPRQPSSEQIKEMQAKMKRLLDSLSDEEKEQLKAMSPEEKGQFFKDKLAEME
jgi:hypothetical protein